MLPNPRLLEYGNEVIHPGIEGNFQTMTALVSARYGHGVCSDGVRFLYVFAGYTGSVTNEFIRIDTTDMTTTQLTRGPNARYSSGVTLSYYNDKIYTFGGVRDVAATSFVVDFWCYDIPTDTWTELTNIGTGFPKQRGYGVAGGGKVWLCGYDYNIYTYDIESMQWSTGVAVPGTRTYYDGAACTDGTNIYISANEGSGTSSFIYTYNTQNSTFFKSKLNTGIRDSKVLYYKGLVYAYRASKLYSYDPVYDIWTLIKTGGASVRRNGIAQVNGTIYSICGDTNSTAAGGSGSVSDAFIKIT